MPAGSGTASRTTVVLLAFAGVAVILTLARVAMAETVLRYDAAGHLLGVSNSDDDPDGCGVPPVACPDDPHGQPICTGGWCGLQCDPGWTDAYGRCADTSSDPTACGPDMAACPAPDHGTATCDQGVCGASCEAGFVASGSKCVSLSTDPGNCGALRKGCPNVPGYVACCSASVCGASDGMACVNVSTDPTNCGWIGHACGPVGANPASCSQGRCAKPAGSTAWVTAAPLEDLDNTTGCYDCFDSALPVGVVMTLRGKWLGTIDRMTFSGPASTWIPYAPQLDEEPLTKVDHTPGPNQFRVLDDGAADGGTAFRPTNGRKYFEGLE